MIRTQEEIDKQINGLKAMKKWLPEVSGMGTENWKEIDAQLDVLEHRSIADDFDTNSIPEEDQEGGEEEIYQAAERAEDWLDGLTEEDLFEEEN